MRRWLAPLGLVAPVLFLLVNLFPPACSAERLPLPRLAYAQERQLRAWLKEHGKSPEEYVVSKFEDHDVVFLGEYHRIRHDPLLVQGLIPALHAHGVCSLGLEFALARDQSLIDSLLAAPAYDEQLANRVFWNQWPWWGYQEYVDILRAAWRLNRSLPPGAPSFRVLGLNAMGDWSRVWSKEDQRNPEIAKTIRPEGGSDSVMAATILSEIVGKHEKGLVYSGIFHAFTCFHQPYPGGPGQAVRFNSSRMGNRVHDVIGNRCCTIYLHAPWVGAGGYDDPYVYPADGAIDALFAGMPPAERRVGFDTAGSPFGKLSGAASYWGRSIPGFHVEEFCDGWIYQMPLSQYEGVHVVGGWFDEQNRLAAIAQIANPDPRVKNRNRTVQDLTAALAEDTDFGRRFAQLR